MPVAQSTYAARMAPGQEGQLATMWGGRLEQETRLCETAAGIGFGRAVSVGTGEKGAILGGTVAAFLGFTIRDITLVAAVGQTVDVYPRYNNMGIMNLGDMWVKAVNGAVLHGLVSFDPVTGQIQPAAGGLVIPGSRWLTAIGVGGLAVARLTRPNP